MSTQSTNEHATTLFILLSKILKILRKKRYFIKAKLLQSQEHIFHIPQPELFCYGTKYAQ